MMMEKSWVMMMHQTDKNTKGRRKIVPQVKRAVCDLESGINWCREKLISPGT